MEQLHPQSADIGTVLRMLRITAEALRRGDIQSGYLLIEFTDGASSAAASIDYSPSWRGKRNAHGADFEFGDWREECDN